MNVPTPPRSCVGVRPRLIEDQREVDPDPVAQAQPLIERRLLPLDVARQLQDREADCRVGHVFERRDDVVARRQVGLEVGQADGGGEVVGYLDDVLIQLVGVGVELGAGPHQTRQLLAAQVAGDVHLDPRVGGQRIDPVADHLEVDEELVREPGAQPREQLEDSRVGGVVDGRGVGRELVGVERRAVRARLVLRAHEVVAQHEPVRRVELHVEPREHIGQVVRQRHHGVVAGLEAVRIAVDVDVPLRGVGRQADTHRVVGPQVEPDGRPAPPLHLGRREQVYPIGQQRATER